MSKFLHADEDDDDNDAKALAKSQVFSEKSRAKNHAERVRSMVMPHTLSFLFSDKKVYEGNNCQNYLV